MNGLELNELKLLTNEMSTNGFMNASNVSGNLEEYISGKGFTTLLSFGIQNDIAIHLSKKGNESFILHAACLSTDTNNSIALETLQHELKRAFSGAHYTSFSQPIVHMHGFIFEQSFEKVDMEKMAIFLRNRLNKKLHI